MSGVSGRNKAKVKDRDGESDVVEGWELIVSSWSRRGKTWEVCGEVEQGK